MQGVTGLLRRAWFQILVSGIVLFYALNRVLQATQNPNFVPTLLVLGAFLVPVVLVLWVYEHPLPEPIPASAVVWNFLWGGALGVIVAGTLEYDTYRALGVLPLLAVGFIEESAKLLVPIVFSSAGDTGRRWLDSCLDWQAEWDSPHWRHSDTALRHFSPHVET